MLRASWILYTTHLRRTFFSKRALVCLLLVLAPLAASLLIATMASEWGSPPAFEILWVLQIQLAVPLVSLLLGSAVVAEEIDDRTITYLFTRPIPRAALYVGRWLAAVTVAAVILGASSIAVIQILAAAAAASAEHALDPAVQTRLLQTILLGCTVYTLFFAALGTLVKHPVIVGLGYTFAFEGILANVPGSGQRATLLYYLKSFLAGDDENLKQHFVQLLEQTGLMPAGDALVRLTIFVVVALVLGGWTIQRRQYVLPS